MIKQAYISAVNGDSDPFPIAEVSYNSKISKAIRYSPYGLCTSAPLNSNVLLLSAHGQESLKYALTDDMQNRYKNLKEGEVVLYNYLSGSFIYLKENGDIEVECKKDEKINVVGDADVTVGGSLTATAVVAATITAPTINLNGNVNISGNLITTGEVTGNGKVLSTHTHPYTWTDPAGSGNTGVPS